MPSSRSIQPPLQDFAGAVQANCHIADALHAGDYTICIYLMKMREYFRWEHGFAFGAELSQEDVGDWLRKREELWEELADQDYQSLPMADTELDPFDTPGANRYLAEYGMVYSGGLGNRRKPHFFLAELERHDSGPDFELFVAGREFARDLASPPAMSLGRQIFIRKESLRRVLWERYEEWRWKKLDNAMGRAVHSYNFGEDAQAALDRMTEQEVESARLHEIGEVEAGRLLGEAWEEMLLGLPGHRTELMLRAVRDHLADALSTLPALLQQQHQGSLHFYFANLTNMRKHLFPGLIDAYGEWRENASLERLTQTAHSGKAHWQQLAEATLALYREHGRQAGSMIETLIESERL